MSDKVVVLADFRAKENEPDPEVVSYDKEGLPMFKYSYSYQHNGRTFTMDFVVHNDQEAKDLLHNLKNTLKLDGLVVSEGYV